MANAIPSYGTILQVNDSDGGTSYTNIADITNPGSPSFSANVVDVTTHNAGSAWREKIPTLLTMDDLTLNVNFVYTNATHSHSAGLAYLFRQRAKRQYRWVNNSDAGADYHQFSAYVTKVVENAPTDGVYNAQITLSITGAPTWTTT